MSLTIQPKYQHDCDNCILLEARKYIALDDVNKDFGIGMGDAFLYDLYVCPASLTLVMRYGDDGPEYYSYSIDTFLHNFWNDMKPVKGEEAGSKVN